MLTGTFRVMLIIALLGVNMAQRWQAAGRDGWHGSPGSENAPNLLKLEQVIDEHMTLLKVPTPYVEVTSALSDALRQLWDEAWNVAIAVIDPLKDMVLYGYAFRNHWAWYNQYKGTPHSIVVWKDYNCRIYLQLDLGATDSNSNGGEADQVRNGGLLDFLTEDNLWESVKRIVEEFQNGFDMVASGVGFDDPAPAQLAVKFCGGNYFGGNSTFYSYQDYPVGNSTYRVFAYYVREKPQILG